MLSRYLYFLPVEPVVASIFRTAESKTWIDEGKLRSVPIDFIVFRDIVGFVFGKSQGDIDACFVLPIEGEFDESVLDVTKGLPSAAVGIGFDSSGGSGGIKVQIEVGKIFPFLHVFPVTVDVPQIIISADSEGKAVGVREAVLF